MKRLALGVAVVLMAETMAKADDPKSYRGAGQEFRVELSRGQGQNKFRVEFSSEASVEERLKRIEEKLDRILEELKGMKGQPQAKKLEALNPSSRPFTFYIGAFY